MDKLAAQYHRLKERASVIHDEITKRFELPPGTLPIWGFYGMEKLFENTSLVFGYYDKD